MTIHKLTAGDGYTYLTRQVASADELRPAGQSLAEYYVARGNPPGVWMGKGAAQLGVDGTTVTEAQMKAPFGQGRHPDRDAMLAAGTPDSAIKLGAAYPSYSDLAPYAERVADAMTEIGCQHESDPETAPPIDLGVAAPESPIRRENGPAVSRHYSHPAFGSAVPASARRKTAR